jgi:hypothetical protein
MAVIMDIPEAGNNGIRAAIRDRGQHVARKVAINRHMVTVAASLVMR